MRNRTRIFAVGCTLAALTALVPTASSLAEQGCRPNGTPFDYTVFYADNARFISIDKNGDGILCIRNNDPKYTGDIDTIKVYDNSANGPF